MKKVFVVTYITADGEVEVHSVWDNKSSAESHVAECWDFDEDSDYPEEDPDVLEFEVQS